MSIHHDHITTKLGCGEDKTFTSTRAFNAWLKMHQKKCVRCSKANVSTINIIARDSVSNTSCKSRENYKEVKEVIADTMRKGVQLKSVHLM